MVVRATVGSCRSVDVLSRSRPARSPGASSDGRCWPTWCRSTRCTRCCSRTRACPMRRSRRCSPCGPRSGSSPRSPPGRSRTASAAAPRSSSVRSCRRSAMRPGSCSPSFSASRSGFVLWGLGGALASGAQEALLHDGLVAVGAAQHYARVQGWVGAAGLVVQVPTAGIATALFVVGGYPAAGWASVTTCLGTAVLAARLPEPGDRSPTTPSSARRRGRTRRTWRPSGTVSRMSSRGRRSSARCWRSACSTGWTRSRSTSRWWPAIYGCPPRWCPWRCSPCRSSAQWAPLSEVRRTGSVPERSRSCWRPGAALLAGAAAVPHPVALVGVALYYGLYRAVLVVADARLQERITGPARATVTSVANVVAELPSFAVYAAWALGGTAAMTVLVALVAALLPVLLRRPDEHADTDRPARRTRADKRADSRRQTVPTRAGSTTGGCPPRPSAAGPAASAAVPAGRGSG